MTAQADPQQHLGTLVCVVLKAKNLPNKRSIGKQDPYCTLTYNGEVQKTKPDKRGGQHPTWDEQLHFEIHSDMEDALLKGTSSEAGSSTTVKGKGRKMAPKTLKVACYADDSKEPDFIGEGFVDLADTLRSGEFDEWVTIKARDRYAGEVYLELTFFSSAAPPKRKKAPKPMSQLGAGDTYGGAGTFSDDIGAYDDDSAPVPPRKQPSPAPPIPSSMRPGGHAPRPSNASGMTGSKSHAHLGSSGGEDVPPILRPSSSMAGMDAYNPPYAPPKLYRVPSPAPPGRGRTPEPGGRRESYQGPPRESYQGHHAQPSQTLAPSASYHQQMPSSSSTHTIRQSWAGPTSGDAADDLARSMSAMSFRQHQHSASNVDKPLPPPEGSVYAVAASIPPPPQATPSPYSVQAELQHFVPAPPPPRSYSQPPPQAQYAAPPTPQPYQHHAPPPAIPPPPPASAPLPGHAGALQAQAHWGGEPARAPSPAVYGHYPTPSDASANDATPTPSLVNAQTLYRPLPSTAPPRGPSPAPSAVSSVAGSSLSYAPPPPPQSFFQARPPSASPANPHRPLPPTNGEEGGAYYAPPQPGYAAPTTYPVPPPPSQPWQQPPPPGWQQQNGVAGLPPSSSGVLYYHQQQPPPPPPPQQPAYSQPDGGYYYHPPPPPAQYAAPEAQYSQPPPQPYYAPQGQQPQQSGYYYSH